MRKSAFYKRLFGFVSLLAVAQELPAQSCTLKEPVVYIHFGQGNIDDVNTTALPGYERMGGSCPTDGHYTFSASTPGCFLGDWFAVKEDHTPGDKNGNMMIVNAYPGGGVFLQTQLKGLRGNTTYELALWLMNICTLERCCSSLSPHIYILLSTVKGKKVIGFSVGELPQTSAPIWKKYKGLFTVPAGETKLELSMQDNAIGGCGNDFALDDITVRECVAPTSVRVAKPKKPAQQKQGPTKKQQPGLPPRPSKQERIAGAKKDSLQPGEPLLVPKTKAPLPVPAVLQTRANPLIKRIETTAGEIKIDLYDNGEIDGDTVSIYHNNQLVVSKARLSQKPISFHIAVNAQEPHHELVMVAENLGTIPPNTSLMILTAGDKKYQVFISSSEQKNARIVVDLKE